MKQVAGVDVGSANVKVVILRNGNIAAHSVVPVTTNVTEAIQACTERALEKVSSSLRDLDFTVATGYGRAAVSFADSVASEVICHAKGVHHVVPEGKTVIDVGAQDSKVIRLNNDGDVTSFVMNDKCASGCGRFFEVIAHALDMTLNAIADLAFVSENACQITSTCTVFAQSEVIVLRARGTPICDIVAGINNAMAKRIVIMGSEVRFESPVVFTGGVAKNNGVKKSFEQLLKTQIFTPEDPLITGALGAALIAESEFIKRVYKDG